MDRTGVLEVSHSFTTVPFVHCLCVVPVQVQSCIRLDGKSGEVACLRCWLTPSRKNAGTIEAGFTSTVKPRRK
jgi:hypothetical protein